MLENGPTASKNYVPTGQLSPANQTKRELAMAAGLNLVRKELETRRQAEEEELGDYEVNTEGNLQRRRQRHLDQRLRRNDYRREGSYTTSRKEMAKRIASKIDIKNPTATFKNVMFDKELRPVLIAVFGDLVGVIPFGFILNWLAWFWVNHHLNKLGISFWKRIKSKPSFEINLLCETIVEMFAFYPGLTIFTIQAMTSEE